MKVFDFDDTIYDGESLYDFFFFMIKKKPQFVKFVPRVVIMFSKYKNGTATFEQIDMSVREAIHKALSITTDTDKYINAFWEKHKSKLKPKFLNMITPDDMIISACPDILLMGIADELGTDKLFCTKVDIESKDVSFFCFGKNKKDFFIENFGNTEIEAFYSDNIADEPMMRLAKHAYLVKGDNIEELHFE